MSSRSLIQEEGVIGYYTQCSTQLHYNNSKLPLSDVGCSLLPQFCQFFTPGPHECPDRIQRMAGSSLSAALRAGGTGLLL